MRLPAGAPVRVVTTKWGQRPHWEFAGRYLGADEHGDWVGFTAGSRFVRPGADYVSPVDQVTVVPPEGGLATFHAKGGPVQVYADVTLAPSWSGARVHTTDLDLDVVLGNDGLVQVVDEDEFERHRVAFGYPDDVVRAARATCERLVAELQRRVPPFDTTTADGWLRRLTGLGSARDSHP